MNKEDKLFKLDKKEICITSTQIKRAIDLLVNENEILQDRIYELEDKYKRMKENAITLSNGYNDLEKRNEKAIEYIGNGNIGIPRKTRDKFISILKGEDKDVNITN